MLTGMFPTGLGEGILSLHLQRKNPGIILHTIQDEHRSHLLAIDPHSGTRQLYTLATRWHIRDSWSHTFEPRWLTAAQEAAQLHHAAPNAVMVAILNAEGHTVRTVGIPLDYIAGTPAEQFPDRQGIRILENGALQLTYSTRTWKYLIQNPNVVAIDLATPQGIAFG